MTWLVYAYDNGIREGAVMPAHGPVPVNRYIFFHRSLSSLVVGSRFGVSCYFEPGMLT